MILCKDCFYWKDKSKKDTFWLFRYEDNFGICSHPEVDIKGDLATHCNFGCIFSKKK